MSRSRSLPYDEISHEYVYGEKSITDNTAREPEHTVMWNAKTRNSNRSHLLGLLVCVFLMFIILTLSSGSNKFPASSTSGRQENACWYFRFVWCFRLATLFFFNETRALSTCIHCPSCLSRTVVMERHDGQGCSLVVGEWKRSKPENSTDPASQRKVCIHPLHII
jgi:hypothetical protein